MTSHQKQQKGKQKKQDDFFQKDIDMSKGEEFSLESILAEFGKGAAESAQDAETTADRQHLSVSDDKSKEMAYIPEPETIPHEKETPDGSTAAEDLVEPKKKIEDEQKSADGQAEISQEKTEPAEKTVFRKKKVLRFPGSFRQKAEEPEAILTAEQDISSPLGHRPEEEDTQAERVPLEEVMFQTVDAALEEQEDALLEESVPLGERLLSWRNQLKKKISDARRRFTEHRQAVWQKPEEEDKGAPEEPEEDLEFAAREEKRRCKRLRHQMLLSAVPVLAAAVLTALDTWQPQFLPALWHESVLLRCGVMSGLLLLAVLASGQVWNRAWRDLRQHRIGCESAAMLAVLAVLGDCAYGAATQQLQHLPLTAPVAVLVWLCLLGQMLTASMHRDIYRLTNLGGCPPYAVTVTAAGTCKQRGRIRGFYRSSRQEDPSRRWQYRLVPLLLAICTILSGAVCLRDGRGREFLPTWSAILTASLPFSLPLTASLPLCNLNRRLCRHGCAVAGYEGAARAGSSRRIVLTDSDIFPQGTVSLNGLKLYGEEIGKVASYAATVTRAARSQLDPIFDQLLTAEGGSYETIQDLHYYEEGGVEGTIHGETVTMGSAYCMKKLHISLPRELKVKTGVFLAVDGQLIAIFAIKYQPSRNAEWALRALRRSRIEPVLASCGANITPGLLRRKFGVDTKPVYPDISTRLALTDLGREKAHRADAVIYREGLMPFVETVTGSRRCKRVIGAGTVLCWLASLCGVLLSYYLTGSAAYQALNGGAVLVFQLLWLLPVWLLASLIKYE